MDNLLLFIRSDKRYDTLLKTYIPALYFNVSAILLLKPHEKKKKKTPILPRIPVLRPAYTSLCLLTLITSGNQRLGVRSPPVIIVVCY